MGASCSIKGLRERGGYTVDIQWENGGLANAQVYTSKEQLAPIRYRNVLINPESDPRITVILQNPSN